MATTIGSFVKRSFVRGKQIASDLDDEKQGVDVGCFPTKSLPSSWQTELGVMLYVWAVALTSLYPALIVRAEFAL